jgi:hypothetical protein
MFADASESVDSMKLIDFGFSKDYLKEKGVHKRMNTMLGSKGDLRNAIDLDLNRGRTTMGVAVRVLLCVCCCACVAVPRTLLTCCAAPHTVPYVPYHHVLCSGYIAPEILAGESYDEAVVSRCTSSRLTTGAESSFC